MGLTERAVRAFQTDPDHGHRGSLHSPGEAIPPVGHVDAPVAQGEVAAAAKAVEPHPFPPPPQPDRGEKRRHVGTSPNLSREPFEHDLLLVEGAAVHPGPAFRKAGAERVPLLTRDALHVERVAIECGLSRHRHAGVGYHHGGGSQRPAGGQIGEQPVGGAPGRKPQIPARLMPARAGRPPHEPRPDLDRAGANVTIRPTQGEPVLHVAFLDRERTLRLRRVEGGEYDLSARPPPGRRNQARAKPDAPAGDRFGEGELPVLDPTGSP